MPLWSFPETIKAGSTATVDVEFSNENPGQRLEDSTGWVVYEISTTGQQITIGAIHNHPAPNGHDANLYAEFTREHLDFGFKEGGTVTLTLTAGPSRPNRMNRNSQLIKLIKDQ